MLDALINWDYQAFRLIYRPEGGVLESVMLALSAKAIWIPLYLVIIQQVISKYGRDAWLPLLILGAVVILADQLTSAWMKPHFARLRPCYDPILEGIEFTRRCGGRFGFASSHAANTMGLAVMVQGLFRGQGAKLLLLWALAVAYSRVYLGVHFPLDVVVGMGVGALLAVIGRLLIKRWLRVQSPDALAAG